MGGILPWMPWEKSTFMVFLTVGRIQVLMAEVPGSLLTVSRGDSQLLRLPPVG